MKKLIYLSLLVFISSSCSRSQEDDCPNKNKDEGLISSDVYFGSCSYNLDEKTFVVQDIDEYDALTQKIEEGKVGTSNCDFPEIDFEKYTLLGNYGEATGCVINFNRNVVADSTSKKIDYIVSPEGCGDCEMLGFSYNFVLVSPKISDDYEILFNGE
ncbi:MAG: hypothetical protein KAH10_04125 [Flavobacteriales bacterium]|nr:hypothetical protein [Flavobacteriales bacterium]